MNAPLTITTDYCGHTCKMLCTVYARRNARTGKFEDAGIDSVDLVRLVDDKTDPEHPIEIKFTPEEEDGAFLYWRRKAEQCIEGDLERQKEIVSAVKFAFENQRRDVA